jgi:hypothetical protein
MPPTAAAGVRANPEVLMAWVVLVAWVLGMMSILAQGKRVVNTERKVKSGIKFI